MKNWKKYFPSKVKYGYDDGYFFYDSRTFNVLFEIKEKRCPEELLDAIQSACNGVWFEDQLEASLKVQDSYRRNKRVYIQYAGRTYTIEFGVSYYLQFVCYEFDKYEAEECEKAFVKDFVDRLETYIAEVL